MDNNCGVLNTGQNLQEEFLNEKEVARVRSQHVGQEQFPSICTQLCQGRAIDLRRVAQTDGEGRTVDRTTIDSILDRRICVFQSVGEDDHRLVPWYGIELAAAQL